MPPAPPAPAPEALRRFPCKQCGAKLEFAPGTDDLTCPYCGCHNQIGSPADPRLVKEIDFLSTLSELKEKAGKFTTLAVQCGACAAKIQAPPNVTSLTCPFCGQNIVATAQSETQIKPNAVLPFKTTRDDALTRFRDWVRSRWFAPTRLRSESIIDARLTGTYLPAWTYDAATTTEYDGERGDAYYTTETYTVNGRTETRQVRHIRWTSVSGVVQVGFDDVLVMASKSLPIKEL